MRRAPGLMSHSERLRCCFFVRPGALYSEHKRSKPKRLSVQPSLQASALLSHRQAEPNSSRLRAKRKKAVPFVIEKLQHYHVQLNHFRA